MNIALSHSFIYYAIACNNLIFFAPKGKYKNVIDCATVTWKEGGMNAIYKGVVPRGTRVMCEVAITMTLYGEIVKGLNILWKTE